MGRQAVDQSQLFYLFNLQEPIQRTILFLKTCLNKRNNDLIDPMIKQNRFSWMARGR
jgi:hypothetical protein